MYNMIIGDDRGPTHFAKTRLVTLNIIPPRKPQSMSSLFPESRTLMSDCCCRKHSRQVVSSETDLSGTSHLPTNDLKKLDNVVMY